MHTTTTQQIDDRPREECGVVAASVPGESVTSYLVDGLHALQHRGQEAAGIAISDGDQMLVVKDLGLVSDALSPQMVGFLHGSLGIGHVRYSTAGDGSWENAQPCFRSTGSTEFAVAHNGNITNVTRREVRVGAGCLTLSDTDAVAEQIREQIHSTGCTFEEAVTRVVVGLEGAYSLVAADHSRIIGVRDPHGFRPLCLGRIGAGWILASETAALDAIGAVLVREIEAGEMVVIEAGTAPRTVRPFPASSVSPNMCILEFVYLSRSDSIMYGTSVNSARLRMGAALAAKETVSADVVVGVPESGLPVAEGYAGASGVVLTSGLVKNRYAGRSFILPNQGDRDRAVRRKINVIGDQVAGKRVVVTDDSVVRGTVTKNLVRMLKEAGAVEVHLRIALPPVKWPCFYGVDISSRDELLAVGKTVEQMRAVIGADSLDFLTVDELQGAIGNMGDKTCTACLTGIYPSPVPQRAYSETGDSCLL